MYLAGFHYCHCSRFCILHRHLPIFLHLKVCETFTGGTETAAGLSVCTHSLHYTAGYFVTEESHCFLSFLLLSQFSSYDTRKQSNNPCTSIAFVVYSTVFTVLLQIFPVNHFSYPLNLYPILCLCQANLIY